MKRVTCLLIATLIVFVYYSCKKSPLTPIQNSFVKVIPKDSSYKTHGCFELADGNYIIYGADEANATTLPLIIKLNQAGDILWQKKLSTNFQNIILKPLADGNLLAISCLSMKGDSLFVCKMAPDNGQIIFNNRYFVKSIIAATDYLPDFVEDISRNEIVICGSVKVTSYFSSFLFKIDNDGNFIQYQVYDTLETLTTYRPTGIALNADGYALVGTVNNSNALFRGMFYMRVTKDLDLVWDTMLFDSTSFLTAAGIIDYSDQFPYIVMGSIGGYAFSGTLYIRKFNSSGSAIENIKTDLGDYENLGRFNGIKKTTDGGYILVGKVNQLEDNNLVSYTKIYLLKLSSTLETEWSKQFNSSLPYNGVSVVQTRDGGYLVGAYEFTSSEHFTMLMIKTNEFGNITWSQ